MENPQGGEEEDDGEDGLPPLQKQNKRNLPPKLTYSAVAKKSTKQAKTKDSERRGEKKENKTFDDPEKLLYDGDSSSTNTHSTIADDKKWTTMEERFQERFDKMEEHFEAQYGRVEGITMEEAEGKIAESIARVQEKSEAFLEKRFQEFTVDIMEKIKNENQTLRNEMVESQEKMFDRFEALQNRQNSRMLSTTESYEKQFDQLFRELKLLKSNIQSTEVTAKSRKSSTVGGEGK